MPKLTSNKDSQNANYIRGKRDAQAGKAYDNPFEPGQFHDSYKRGYADGKPRRMM